MATSTDDKILKAFNQLVIQYGYQKTTTKQIAKEAGINESTVFRHFPTKEDILNTQLKLNMQSIEAIISNLKVTHNLYDDIVQMGVTFINYAQNNPAIFLLGIRESYHYPQIREAIQKLPERLMKLLFDWLTNVYGIKINAKIQYKIQNIFILIFGQLTLKYTYHQSDFVNDDQEFINNNFKALVDDCIHEIKKYNHLD